jgi:hypothetical protein
VLPLLSLLVAIQEREKEYRIHDKPVHIEENDHGGIDIKAQPHPK